MKYNIIGDIHCRDYWKKLIRKDCVNIFIGDYFSPYDDKYINNFELCKNNFLDIINYKKQHPETILLIGNHDLDHWYLHEKYSYFDNINYNTIYQLFEENKDLLQVAYAIDDNVLVTHAGVSAIWYERYHNTLANRWKLWYTDLCTFTFYNAKTIEDAFELYKKDYNKFYEDHKIKNIKKYIIEKPLENYLYFWIDGIYIYKNDKFIKKEYNTIEVATFINNLFLNGLEENGKIQKYYQFNFENNCGPTDYNGNDVRHSPLWIRPDSLIYSNIFSGTNIWQIVGHTKYNNIIINDKNKLVYCDCLEYNTESVIYDSNTKNFEINKKNNI